jgi:Pyruvate:ferredoxin oxidoreductase and related 2-oxoacid:ferredoxin oxidoreductases, gamma subunit
VAEVFSALLVGVGGQGIVLSSDILAEAAAISGLDVKKSEIHGMSRRGGPVFSHVRFGQKIHSAVIPTGTADLILAMEPMELLRWAPWARAGAAACYLSAPIFPVGVSDYPDELEDELSGLFPRLVRIDLASIRRTVPLKVRNTALLGAASVFLPLAGDAFADAITALAPKGSAESNQSAFEHGRDLALAQVKEPANVE